MKSAENHTFNKLKKCDEAKEAPIFLKTQLVRSIGDWKTRPKNVTKWSI